jgi:hypothetical protein
VSVYVWFMSVYICVCALKSVMSCVCDRGGHNRSLIIHNLKGRATDLLNCHCAFNNGFF